MQFLNRAQDIVHQADEQCDRAGVHAEVFREGPEAAVYHVPGDIPRQITGPVDHRDQGSDGDADQAEFQDEGDCGHEVKDGFDNRARLGHQEAHEHEAPLRAGKRKRIETANEKRKERKKTKSDIVENTSLFYEKS